MTILIDADSFIFIIAWYFKEVSIEQKTRVEQACDTMMHSIIRATKATSYFGSFSSSRNFRHELYKHAVYKGTRKPREEWLLKWENIIKYHFTNRWGFYTPIDLEADDVVCAMHNLLKSPDSIIVSPDKDLQQIAGLHFNYKKMDEGIKQVDQQTASYNFWLSMLTGDTVDNIRGLPGIGEVKAKAILIGKNAIECEYEVLNQYIKFFGDYYGTTIYRETKCALQLLCPDHSEWDVHYKTLIERLIDCIRKVDSTTIVQDENIESLKSLGWA